MSILLTTLMETYCSLWVLQRKEQSVSNWEAILSCSEVPRRYLDATPERSWCGRRGCRGSEAGNNLWGRLHHLQSQWLFQTADWPWMQHLPPPPPPSQCWSSLAGINLVHSATNLMLQIWTAEAFEGLFAVDFRAAASFCNVDYFITSQLFG